MLRKTDFLVVGSGIAGLTYALKVAKACPDKQVLVITKDHCRRNQYKICAGWHCGCYGF